MTAVFATQATVTDRLGAVKAKVLNSLNCYCETPLMLSVRGIFIRQAKLEVEWAVMAEEESIYPTYIIMI